MGLLDATRLVTGALLGRGGATIPIETLEDALEEDGIGAGGGGDNQSAGSRSIDYPAGAASVAGLTVEDGWQDNHGYIGSTFLSVFLRPGNGHIYVAGGTFNVVYPASRSWLTGGVEPVWPTNGGSVSDGDFTWRDLGLSSTYLARTVEQWQPGTDYTHGDLVHPEGLPELVLVFDQTNDDPVMTSGTAPIQPSDGPPYGLVWLDEYGSGFGWDLVAAPKAFSTTLPYGDDAWVLSSVVGSDDPYIVNELFGNGPCLIDYLEGAGAGATVYVAGANAAIGHDAHGANARIANVVTGRADRQGSQFGTQDGTIGLHVFAGDPSAGAGVAANKGSLLSNVTGGELWMKTGDPDTGWTRLAMTTDLP